MSITHLLLPEFIQRSRYSSVLFWTVILVIGMIVTFVYNIKMGVKKGYETHLGRALKITWGVFNIAWIAIVVMSIFAKIDSCDFNYLKKMTNSTQGNLSIQLKRLFENNYISITKSFEKNYPKTSCRITKTGATAFASHFKALQPCKNLDL